MAKKPQKRAVSAPRKTAPNRSTTNRQKITADNVFDFLSLKNVRLIDMNVHLELHDNELPTAHTITASMEVGHTEDKAFIQVTGVVNVVGRPKDAAEGAEGVSALDVRVVLQCLYAVEGADVSEIGAQSETLARTGMLIMWPHFREIVQSATLRTGVPAIVLPFFAGAPGKNIPRGGKSLALVKKKSAQ